MYLFKNIVSAGEHKPEFNEENFDKTIDSDDDFIVIDDHVPVQTTHCK